MTGHTGGCLCGAVRYVIDGPIGDSVACHCSQCRKNSGHYWSSSQAPVAALRLSSADSLTWYRSSATAKRGFCTVCGSSLFWEMDGEGMISVASGTLDTPTGTRTKKHIFTADKADYYDLPDSEVQIP
ncbi:MAG: GFA family protein [Maritimibacter sp.]|nr:GFA family protein [Maritimibacter sp.]